MEKMKLKTIIGALLLISLIIPLVVKSQYLIHLATIIFIWSFLATAWSYMARFGLVSLGHGAFMGVGAYVSLLLFNYYGMSPWIGMIIGALAATLVAAVLGYACFRSGVVGDYFALVTLALAEVVALTVVALRGITGGSLGVTLKKAEGIPWLYLQSDSKIFFYYLSLCLLFIGFYIWHKIDTSRMQKALKAIGEDEIAAASLGIKVIKYKMMITIISAFCTAIGGVIYVQYITYMNPHTVSGVGISLSICFKAIIGGMFTMMGPLIGSTIMISMEEFFRIAFGSDFVSVSQVIFGIALVALIIFLPKGIYGTLKDFRIKKSKKEKKAILTETISA